MSGGTGDDKLYGGGIDLLDGGEGNDYLNGGFGNDIYVYRQNYGHHTIQMKEVKEIACTYLILALMISHLRRK
ncbi:hypothetical protein ACLB1E_35995 [Escherichia coli]